MIAPVYRTTSCAVPVAPRARSGAFPSPPPAPRALGWCDRDWNASIEDAFRAELARARRVEQHGAGMLAELEHQGVPVTLVARGVLRDPIRGVRWVDAVLRTEAPADVSLEVRTCSLFERVFRPAAARAVDRVLGGGFVVLGTDDVVAALLDDRVRRLLASMAADAPSLRVQGGMLDLAWRGRFPTTHNVPILDPTALAIVTSLGRALYAS